MISLGFFWYHHRPVLQTTSIDLLSDSAAKGVEICELVKSPGRPQTISGAEELLAIRKSNRHNKIPTLNSILNDVHLSRSASRPVNRLCRPSNYFYTENPRLDYTAKSKLEISHIMPPISTVSHHYFNPNLLACKMRLFNPPIQGYSQDGSSLSSPRSAGTSSITSSQCEVHYH